MNRQEQVRMIKQAVNPRAIRSTIMDLSVYHRLWTTDDITAAATHARDLFGRYGLDARLYTYPSSPNDRYRVTPYPQCWMCKHGWCELVGEEGRHIADFDADHISILDDSVSMDYRNTPVEIVYMDRGPEEEKYADIDFNGKLIFIKSQEGHYFNTPAYTRWACGKRGAIGLILSAVATEEGVRGYWNQYDTIAWSHAPHGCVGFGITPREGDHLARLILAKREKGEPMMARFYTETVTEGVTSMSNAEGIIHGEFDEEIVLYGHLCHPRPSANDNLSGVSAVLEAMRTLNDLISRGFLPKPKRSIRGIVGPEMYGSTAELCRDRTGMPKLRAAFNMDMVGAMQGPIGVGPIQLVETPRAIETVINDVASFVFREVTKDTHGYNGEWICTHNMMETSFSGGSDQDVFNDPEQGAPCTYTAQWPDRFYHSSSDDIATIDPSLIAYSAAISASYAYLLATMEEEDLVQYMAVGAKNLVRNMNLYANRDDKTLFEKTMRHLRDYSLACCKDYPNWFDGEAKKRVQALVDAQLPRLEMLASATADSLAGYHIDLDAVSLMIPDTDKKYDITIERNFVGRMIIIDDVAQTVEGGTEALRAYESGHRNNTRGCAGITSYYLTGNRTLAEAFALAAIDKHVPTDALVETLDAVYRYLLLLEKLGALKIIGKVE